MWSSVSVGCEPGPSIGARNQDAGKSERETPTPCSTRTGKQKEKNKDRKKNQRYRKKQQQTSESERDNTRQNQLKKTQEISLSSHHTQTSLLSSSDVDIRSVSLNKLFFPDAMRRQSSTRAFCVPAVSVAAQKAEREAEAHEIKKAHVAMRRAG